MTPGKDELLFLPLGGAGEIGMNLNLYGHAGKWLMVDLGVTFAGPEMPGIDVIMPDPQFIAERRDDLVGLVLTHGHEDHLGAVAHLWDRLRCPVYATPFTAELLRGKLIEAGLEDEVPVHILPMSGRVVLEPFTVELITLTHSIPEPNALLITTKLGTVLHTGDWKLDEAPLVGESYDRAALEALSDSGILAMVCDSTNVMVPGETGSETEVRENLFQLIGELPNRIAVACFASNVARLETVAKAAQHHGRHVALAGRSMVRIVEAAKACGYLQDLPPFVPLDKVMDLPREKTLLLCTGSQGEKRAALSRIAHGDHHLVDLDRGDNVIFSSRVIPGNEKSIMELQNALARQGLNIITDSKHFIHVSGHPAREDLMQMYRWVRPKIAVPVHGEYRHLAAHVKLARECQIPEQVLVENGGLVRLAPGKAKVIDHVPSGRLVLDGDRLVDIDSPMLRERRRLGYGGHVSLAFGIDKAGQLATPVSVKAKGLLEAEWLHSDLDEVGEQVEKALDGLSRRLRRDPDAVEEAARLAARRCLQRLTGLKPAVTVHLVEV